MASMLSKTPRAKSLFWTGLNCFGTSTITGAALLTGRFVPLVLTVLAPVIVNIVAVHLFLTPSGFPLTILVVALELFLAWSYRAAFRSLLRARNDATLAR